MKLCYFLCTVRKRSRSRTVHNKTKMVAAIISNCDDILNGRLDFIKELQKYVEVDVYGKCGNFSCPKSRENTVCMTMIEEQYKFYLSFENSNCEDYITEKLFVNALR
jgi:glycoprotein 3-alpha-L-fucosyltransferase